MKKEKHPYKKQGHLVIFPNGNRWSCVDLTENLSMLTKEDIDHMFPWGHFEAMRFDEENSIREDSPQIRAKSFDELFEELRKIEEIV